MIEIVNLKSNFFVDSRASYIDKFESAPVSPPVTSTGQRSFAFRGAEKVNPFTEDF